MIIRTISQLPKVTNLDAITTESLFEVSLNVDEQYISKAVSYGTFLSKLSGEIASGINVQYGYKNGIKLSSLNSQVELIQNGDCEFKGIKNLTSCEVNLSTVPYDKDKVAALDAAYRSQAATIGYVHDALSVGSTFMSNQSKATGFVASTGLYYAAQPDGLMSFMFNEESASRTSTTVQCPQTGNLTLYGWLADNGNVDAAQAWVALEAYSDTVIDGGAWIIVAVQPWIMGSKHSNLQYVGFNVPVSKGMQLRITTGFDLNYSNSTYQQRKNTLVRNINSVAETSITNAFIGYVLY